MALSIKTDDADRLARELARLTGESMTEAVTRALAERLDRERATREADRSLPQKLEAIAAGFRQNYDQRPVSKQEWDNASGEDI
jgi:antitoxin VapB